MFEEKSQGKYYCHIVLWLRWKFGKY